MLGNTALTTVRKEENAMRWTLHLLLSAIVLSSVLLLNHANATEMKLLKTKLKGPPTEEFGLGCSLGCAVGWDMTASSTREPQGKVKYGIDNIYDGNLKTAWIPTNNGIGESLSFVFQKNHFSDMQSVTFWGLEIINGYIKSKAVWRENARVKRIRIEHNNKPLYELQLIDSMEVQSVRFAPITIRPGSIVKLVILETYPGTRFQDVAITEIIPHGAH
jgi:hypothetical protein